MAFLEQAPHSHVNLELGELVYFGRASPHSKLVFNHQLDCWGLVEQPSRSNGVWENSTLRKYFVLIPTLRWALPVVVTTALIFTVALVWAFKLNANPASSKAMPLSDAVPSPPQWITAILPLISVDENFKWTQDAKPNAGLPFAASPPRLDKIHAIQDAKTVTVFNQNNTPTVVRIGEQLPSGAILLKVNIRHRTEQTDHGLLTME